MNPRFLTIGKFHEWLNARVSPPRSLSRTYAAVRAGNFPTVEIAGRVHIDIEAYERQRAMAAEKPAPASRGATSTAPAIDTPRFGVPSRRAS